MKRFIDLLALYKMNRLHLHLADDQGSRARDAYEWDPATVYDGVSEASIAGIEAPLWTETVTSIRDAEFLAFPRLVEIAEVAWSPAAGRRWDEFRIRLGAQAPRWSALGINFYRSPQVPWR